ncbi:carbohydrate ABC transporter permease [Pseudonocardia sp. TRM90224]|uniref:carbohydrate ABC transporter permease n=1 Tax=Pseudonocardia sp. TRM90224 TaxID=2812678 RepID=UPI001E5ED941|nr:sugar ABC transporter permease [Pseudonocardia sp. TRM90224]
MAVVTEAPVRAPRRGGRQADRAKEAVAGYVFLSPWLLGLFGVTLLPMLYSLYLSFTDYDLLQDPEWVGVENYVRMFTDDPKFWSSVGATLLFAVVSVPLKLAVALGVALLLYRNRRGVGMYRSLYYVPSLLGGSVAIAIVWQTLFSGQGAVNEVLGFFGIQGWSWITNPSTALGTLVLLAAWQFGAPMVIFLAGLKQIPAEMFEAASLDGAGRVQQFVHVTLPLLSPVLFFNLVLETIAGFQGFTAAFVISGGTGGPADSTLLYTLYLYMRGFGDFQMGYASAMAWVFLVALGVVTALVFRSGSLWVHYADEGDR